MPPATTHSTNTTPAPPAAEAAAARSSATGRLLLLGPVTWLGADGPQPLPPERGVQLLAWLGQRHQWVERAQAASLLWPDADVASARRNLRKVLFRIGTWGLALPPVEQRGMQLRWAVDTDVLDFERALAAQDVDTALALWRGEPWSGIDADDRGALGDWVRSERVRLSALWRDASLRRATSAGPVQRTALARALVDADPFDEEALRLLLQALVADGRRHEARDAYTRFEQALKQSFGLQPAAATRQCIEDRPVPPPERPAAPAAGAHDAAGSDANAFVGRRAERQALEALLAEPGRRWVTVTGLGGAGKTRLARALHAALTTTWPGGATWVELEDAPTAQVAHDRIAEALGQPPSREPLRAIAAALAAQPRLLVLDNLEHLADAAQALAAALAGCPGVVVLATSRARLGVPGEAVFPLAGLPWPSEEDRADALRFDAVKLFLARAADHRSAQDAPLPLDDVVRVCAAVEGLPLAVELAAVWTRHLGVGEIADELASGRVALLDDAGHGTPQSRPARHASAAASFDHSWRLLTPAEQRLLATLSLLRGGFSRLAALEVGDAPLPVLAGLLDKSMVRRDDDVPARAAARYSLHPLVQQLAADRLAEQPLLQVEAQTRLSRHFCRVLAELPTMARPAQRVVAARALAPDLANLGLAWRLAVAMQRVDLLRPCIVTMRSVHMLLGRWNDGEALLDAVEPLMAGDDSALGEINAGRTTIALFRGDFDDAVAHGRRACRLLRRRADAATKSEVLGNMTYSLLQGGHVAAARRCNVLGLSLAREADVGYTIAGHLMTLANIEYQSGDFDSGAKHSREAVELRRSMDSPLAAPLTSLIHCLFGAERYQEALAASDEALLDCDKEPAPGARSYVLVMRANALLPLGRIAESRADVQAALDGLPAGTEGGLRVVIGLAQAAITLAEGDWRAAWTLLADAVQRSLSRGQGLNQADALRGFGEALAAAGQHEEARLRLAQAAALPAANAWSRARSRRLLRELGGDAEALPAPLADASLNHVLLELAARRP